MGTQAVHERIDSSGQDLSLWYERILAGQVLVSPGLFQFADGETGEKSEEPTSKRLSDARNKGNIAKSQDLSTAFILIVTTIVIYFMLPALYQLTEDMFRLSVSRFFIPEIGAQDMWNLFLELVGHFAWFMLPIFLAVVLSTVIIFQWQIGEFMFTLEPMKPDINRFNPVNGLKKIFGKEAVAELIKSILKLVILGYFPYRLISNEYPKIATMFESTLGQSLDYISWLIVRLILEVGIVLLIYGIFDLIWLQWKRNEDLKMTKQEVKEERKQSEGDPLIKSKIRQKQREIAQGQMMAAVPKADVVVTNPTHYAVALRYEQGKDEAPRVVAKGRNLIAQKIKEIARENGVMLYEDKALARALFSSCEIDQLIPEVLFAAVAKVLAVVMKGRKGQFR